MAEKLTSENCNRLMAEYQEPFENEILCVLSRMHCNSIEDFCSKTGVTRMGLFLDWYNERIAQVCEELRLQHCARLYVE